MKKNKLGWLLAVPALFGFGMTSCQSNDIADEYIETEGELVEVSLTAVMPEADTRATLAPDNQDKKVMKFKWESTDKIQVVNAANGKYLGELGVKNISSTGASCQFSGGINIPDGENLSFNFYYLGTEGAFTKTKNVVDAHSVTFAMQDGSINGMRANDILTGNGTYKNTATATNSLGTIVFERYFSAGYFTLKYDGTTLNVKDTDVTITAAEGTLYPGATLNAMSKSFTPNTEEGKMVVNVKNDDIAEAFYLNIVPANGLKMKFSCTVNGEYFEGTTKNAWNIPTSKYYTNVDNSGGPVVIEMRHTDGRDDERDYTLTYNSNFGENVAISDVVKGTVSAEIAVKDYTAVGSDNNKLPVRTYYSFTGWAKTSDGDVEYTSSDKITFAWNDENKTVNLYAKWQWSKYLIKFEKNDDTEKGDLPKDIDGTVAEGNNPSVSLPKEGDDDFKLSKDGYEFVGWKVKGTDDNNIVSNPYTVTETNPEVTLVPVWKVKKSGVTGIAPGATGSDL